MDTIEYRAKRCNKCKIIYYPAVSFFYKNKSKKNNLSYYCKKCCSIQDNRYRSENKEKIKKTARIYRRTNKEKIKKVMCIYRGINKEKIKEGMRIYRKTNKEKIKKSADIYREINQKKIKKNAYIYREINREKIKERKLKNEAEWNRKAKISLAKDVTYIRLKEISKYEDIQEHPERNDIGQIKCAYCGKWTTLSFQMFKNRKREILTGNGGSLIYCSTECKVACPTYGQQKYPKGFKSATSREVNPLLRQICFELDDYTCQKCYKKENIQLHCHHIQGAVKEPLLSNDIDNVITFCKECHEQVHQEDGCSYNDYRRKQCA